MTPSMHTDLTSRRSNPHTLLPPCPGVLHRGITGAIAVACLLLAGVGARAADALEPGPPFADGAVLQRSMQVPVWGWGRPGAEVAVEFAGQRKTTRVGQDGRWRLDLDPLEASFEPGVMTIRDDTGAGVAIEDVLVGEVWMASGQSNMQWRASKSDVGSILQKQIKARVEAGDENPPVIREAVVTDRYSQIQPVEHATVQWSDDANQMSAIAYAFAYELYRELDVPIGILNCAFSTTAIQAWVPREGFRDGEDDYTQQIYQRVLESDPDTPQHRAAWDAFYQTIEDTLQENAEREKRGEEPVAIPASPPGVFKGNRDATWMYNAHMNPMVPYAIRGAIWNQGYASINEGLAYYHNLHSLVRGWRIVWERPDLPVYFHQFYTPRKKRDRGTEPSLNATHEMRLGTWMARDIPNTGMASQIDIGGSIHYARKTLPGQRLARHALKNQYADVTLRSGHKARDLVADGPMFRDYTVEGDKLIAHFDHAEGGLVVAQYDPANDRIGTPQVIPGGADELGLFYLADENRVWHPAKVKLDGEQVILTAPGVGSPRGVTYGTSGIGFKPNLYNRALLPTTPFMVYDHQIVTRANWPEEKLTIAGKTIDPGTVGLVHEYRKMPLLSTQFRDRAVLQAGVPVTIWGSARHAWHSFGYEAEADGKGVVHFSFAGIEKTIPVTPDMSEWRVTLPPMPASAEPHTLKVSFTIDGELVHERVARDVVFGDVWYIAAPPQGFATTDTAANNAVRMMQRRAKRSSHPRPSRFSIAVSSTPGNRFASEWETATGFPATLGNRIFEKTGRPVGIIFMRTTGDEPPLKSWIAAECLDRVPSFTDDFKQLATLRPGNRYYDANARQYIDAWKTYWRDYVPALMESGAVPDDVAWGKYPSLASNVTTKASETYNILVHSFTPASLKGVVFLAGEGIFKADGGAAFAEQMTALANCWKEHFAGEDPWFLYTLPAKTLAPKAAAPSGIEGRSAAIPITQWPASAKDEDDSPVVQAVIDSIMADAYTP